MQPLLHLPGPAANARLTSLGAKAQEQSVSAQCDGISGVNEASNSAVTGCLKPVINYHSLIAASDAVRRVVAGQLAGAVSSSPNLQASRWRGLKMSPHASLATIP